MMIGQKNILKNLPGWCTVEKMAKSKELCYWAGNVVEIGTFGGSWLLPMACEMPNAHFIGIDPYDAGACVEGMTSEENIAWWDNQRMLNDIYNGVIAAVVSLELSNVQIMRKRGEDCSETFANESIDIWHSDGNHSAEPTMRTVKLYVPKVKVGGIIIQDDVSWTENGVETVRPALDWMLKQGNCELICEVTGAAFLRKR